MAERLQPLLEQVASLPDKILSSDRRIEQPARTQYPETELLKQVQGVGTLIALTFVLPVEDAARFAKPGRGCYAGLRRKHSNSGESEPSLVISKEGDTYVRKLLVPGAHYILGQRGPDTDRKRWGWKRSARGGQEREEVCGKPGKLLFPLSRSPARNKQTGKTLIHMQQSAPVVNRRSLDALESLAAGSGR